MESIANLLNGFSTAISFFNIFCCLVGVSVGMIVGIMPGIGSVAGTALLIPLTFGMEPVSAVIMLSGIYYGSMYGGTITSVLINTPGEAASVITCLDGYQMARQGRAGTALGVSAIGSFIGGTFSVIMLTLLSSVLVKYALKFGPPETFCLMLFGIVMLVGMMGKSVVKGLIAAAFGCLLAFVGMDAVTGAVRFSFGSRELMRGFDLTTLCMGMFGISEIMLSIEEGELREMITEVKKLLPEKEEWGPTLASIARGTGIGFLSGLVPGCNAIVPTVLSYSLEKRIAKDPDRFGKGAIEGVAGPETANNSFAGAAIIPLLTLGIPTSATISILYGAFLIHGLTPGPLLFQNNGDFVWALIASFYIGNVILVIMNMPLAKYWAKLALVPFKIMYPFIVCFCVIGAFSANNNLWDVGCMMLFGLLGYAFKKLEIPLAPVILTFVLGGRLENNLVQSLSISRGSLLIFFTRPICLVFIVLIVFILALSAYSAVKGKRDVFVADAES
jgi:putative tricarboxylic transport membrane protein